MDDARFDALSRSVATMDPSRRSLVLGLASLLAAGAGPALGAAAKKKRKKKKKGCKGKRKHSCGQNCCQRQLCFANDIDGGTGRIESFGCCPAKNLCVSYDERPDQCCYDDERCDPYNPALIDRGEVCCRACGDPPSELCCSPFRTCVNGACIERGSARLARYRR
jgi:hypothetical protein